MKDDSDMEAMIDRAIEKGVTRALHRIGLDQEDAVTDIRDLRSLMAGFRMARRTFVQTTVKMLTAGFLLALMAGVAIRMKLFNGGG